MEGAAADDLHVVMALAEHSFGRLTNRGEGFDHEVVELGTIRQPLPILDGLRRQRVIGEKFEFRFQGVDGVRHLGEILEGATLTGSHQLRQKSHTAPMLLISGDCGFESRRMATIRRGSRSDVACGRRQEVGTVGPSTTRD